MASSSSSPFVPAFSSQPWKYHVFLSFRGEDTRKTFVDHLYSALEQQGIYTYKDDETLPRGESIGPSLMKAIEESQIAVIIFSENYADSSWCLDELAYVMECKDTKGQIVMPIFYDVDPSEVRKQKRKYGEAFAKHELENKKKSKSWGQAVVENLWGWFSAPREQNGKYQEALAKHELENKTKVESWRKALVDASNISGWEPKHIANGDESKCIKQIVVEISQKLYLPAPRENENLIGMAARMQRLKLELEVGSGGVHMIGIWGVGGGGKTTLASSIYDEIRKQFDGCCFIQNIREEASRYGLGKLEEDILSKMGMNRVGGRCMIKKRLCHRKVLIVLDDVDHLDQLRALAGSNDWFGEGSRIIITTRDKHLLAAHKVNVIHNISLLSTDEAIKLFSKHAPRDNRPVEDYNHLSKEVVSYAGGLPLALTVLGSFLCDTDINEWKSALTRLKDIPDTDIVEKLKISFDGLKPIEKELFLDIACFFRRVNKTWAMNVLDDCGFHPVIGVKVLIQKALITISPYGEFDMHDLVQEMGHHIVRGEHPNNPEKHSRIWKEEDILKICAMDSTMELDMIEAISIKYSGEDQLQRYKHPSPIVANAKNLRWINWQGDFASPLLTNFPQRTLCCLLLSNCLQEQLWDGYKLLPNLKTIELWSLPNLIMTPDFDGLPNLERFRLTGCKCLEEIHPSIGRVERLVLLYIYDCPSLKMFPPFTGLKKLETLSFAMCTKLFQLSKIQQQNMGNLGQVHLDNRGTAVASYIESITNIFVNCWRCCCNNRPGVECCLEEPSSPHNNMKPCLHDSNMNHIGLWFFLKDLTNLNLSYCDLGDEEMGSAVWELPNLKKLDLSGNNFSRLNLSLLQIPRLKCLDVSSCEGLVELSELPSSIAVVKADYCDSLESFGDISNCKWLWNISLDGENKLGEGDILLDSMLQGNAIEDYFINIILEHQITRFMKRKFKGTTFTLRLPHDWYNEFFGFLICVVIKLKAPYIKIVIKQEVDEDSLFEPSQESNESLGPIYYGRTECIGYVSFGSLRHTTISNSSCTMISVSLHSMYENSIHGESYVGAELVPRRSKGDQVQTTKVTTGCSEFWDEEFGDRPPFTIQHDSKSSINILWRAL